MAWTVTQNDPYQCPHCKVRFPVPSMTRDHVETHRHQEDT